MLNTFPTPLILVDSSVAVPTASREVARLTDKDRLLAAFNAPTAFTLFHEAVLGAHGIDPRQSSSTRPPSELAYSAIAATSTSLSTLLAAVATPLAERSCHRVSAGLVCQSTLDEAVSQSQACWMAGLVGTDCTVLGVAAGQAATLHAIEMGAALMQDSDEPSIALLVAAERWLAPYPRTIDGFSVRGDAAAGVSITNDPEAQGWQLTGIVTESPSRAHDHVETVDREANPIIEYWGVDEIQRQAMVNRLTRAIRRLFDATNLTPAEITVVIPPLWHH
ncbi:MAG: hypothetical protein M5U09_09985 [Gammaproteobacteria bacterium]|nr:hypothetical protein [Gammaproteobacteria bacterium]